ncbi:restriction endonuclease subunit S [Photobacterium halotolerans]|uniref:restriction endonuclease subunit S n=1 Tax=Photobacterium halotolerans TaxID=265726 RepID=UPI0013734221|nr:restriction endonuclease subunit S [Photobacterium halotolerans]NAX47777.1 restriction endonuclease subunit S [Photobacterium halotolerans]
MTALSETKKYQAYPEYKDSGVEWLEEVPSDWDVIKIKHLSPVKRGASPRPIDDPKYFDEEGEYAWVRIADVSASKTYLETTTQIMSELGSSLSVKLEPNQLFLSIAGTVGKPCINKIKACIHDGFVYFPDLKIPNKYLFYVFAGEQAYKGLGKMGTQLNLNTDTVGDIKVTLPREHGHIEQIVHFLDHETAKIDTLIEKQQQLIKLLKEKRQAVISHAVTKGLNPQAPMKDSGVEWLGEVPEHWDVSRLKFECDVVDCRNKTPEYFENGEYFVVRTTNVKKQKLNFNGALYTDKKNFDIWTQRGIPPSGSILFTREAPTGEVCLVPDNLKFCMGQRMMNFISNSQAYTNYLFDYLISDCLDRYINSVSHGSTVSHLRVEQVENIPVPVPPQKELIAIHEHILNLKTQYDDLESNALKAIDLMKERRTALISAAVTGKIDVRNWQAPGVQHAASVHEPPLEAMA